MKSTKNKTYEQFGNHPGIEKIKLLSDRFAVKNPTASEIALATLATQILPAIVGAPKASKSRSADAQSPWYDDKGDAEKSLRRAVELASILIEYASEKISSTPESSDVTLLVPKPTKVDRDPSQIRKDLLSFVVGKHTSARDQTSQAPRLKRFFAEELSLKCKETIAPTDDRVAKKIDSYIVGNDSNQDSWNELALEFKKWWPLEKKKGRSKGGKTKALNNPSKQK